MPPRGKWFEDDDDPDGGRWLAADTLAPRRFDGKDLRRVENGALAEPVPVYHRQQDEYCEWFVSRSAADPARIDRVTFTSEGPGVLAVPGHGHPPILPRVRRPPRHRRRRPGAVVDLYREHVDTSGEPDDLVWPFDVAAWDGAAQRWYLYGRAGDYNPFNRWNTTDGAMHLTHPANTLRGEFTVASRAAVLRRDALGRPVDDTENLVCCSGFGDPNRSSDPAIGGGVNGLVASGMSISLADPVGVYIAGINLAAFNGPRTRTSRDVDRHPRRCRPADDPAGHVLRARRPRLQRRAGPGRRGAGGLRQPGRRRGPDGPHRAGQGPGSRHSRPGRGETKCCRHPGRPGIETVVELDVDCAAFDWSTIEPILPAASRGDRSPGARAPAPDPTLDGPVADDGPEYGAVALRR